MANNSLIDCRIGEGTSNAEMFEEQTSQRSTRKRKISVPVESDSLESMVAPINKRPKWEDDVTESDSGTRNEDDQKRTKSIDDLPPEMLEAVLRRLATSDLVKWRQVNRKFNQIASLIMRQRSDITLHFSSADGKYLQYVPHRHCEELLVNICETYSKAGSKSLVDLVECLQSSEHFPITSFKWDGLQTLGLANEHMESFLSIWGRNVFAFDISMDDSKDSAEILRNLLVDKLPNLKKLQIRFRWPDHPSTIQLFVDSNEFQLPKLQVLIVNESSMKFRGIVEDILQAACNLTTFFRCVRDKIQAQSTCVEEGITVDELTMLESYNKLHCIKKLRLDLSTDLVTFWQNSPNIGDVKLESLAVSLSASVLKNEKQTAAAIIIVNRLFQSSADALETLAMAPLGSATEIVIPKMTKLTKLDLWGRVLNRSNTPTMLYDMFPPFFQMADYFPNLKELGVHFRCGDGIIFPTSQPLKPLTRVAILRIRGNMSTETTEMLMKATPNVTTLVIEETSMAFDEAPPVNINFEVIANYLPKLQSFGWRILRLTHHTLLHSLDAAITGLPVKFCKENSEKFRNKTGLTADELVYYQSRSRNPSILDLKELKQLDVNFLMDGDAYADMDYEENECDCVDSDCEDFICECYAEKPDETGFEPGDLFYKTGFSKVSKFLAFDLMPNLKIRTHRYLD